MVQWNVAQGDDQRLLQECPGWTIVVKLRGASVGQLRANRVVPMWNRWYSKRNAHVGPRGVLVGLGKPTISLNLQRERMLGLI